MYMCVCLYMCVHDYVCECVPCDLFCFSLKLAVITVLGLVVFGLWRWLCTVYPMHWQSHALES